jgi:hypothetical protein
MKNIKEVAVPFTLVLAAMVGWYCLYVKPTDEFRYAVMDCMAERGDSSKEGYKACVELLAATRR